MGNISATNLNTMQNNISYEDIQFIISNQINYLLINTMPENEQQCLIINTINVSNEANLINKYLTTGNTGIQIIIYGKNNLDDTVYKKYSQLKTLGFCNIFIYVGGLFEWLLLQDIYGKSEFRTTSVENDLLKYKPIKKINNALLTNY